MIVCLSYSNTKKSAYGSDFVLQKAACPKADNRGDTEFESRSESIFFFFARQSVISLRARLVRDDVFSICIALQSLELSALEVLPIIARPTSCAPRANACEMEHDLLHSSSQTKIGCEIVCYFIAPSTGHDSAVES